MGNVLKRLASWTMVAAVVLCAGAARAQELNAEVQRLISRGKLGEAKIGISIVDCETGRVLADVNASRPLVPASNMKLLTTGAALLVLGPDFVFRTEFASVGERVVVRGSGDPALADPVVLSRLTPRMTVAEVVARIAEAGSKAGLTNVGEIVVDDRVFERERVHPCWPTDQLDRGYCAEVAGVNFHANVLAVFPKPNPDGVGHSAMYALEPEAPWLRLEVAARTVAQGQNSAWVRRIGQGNQFELLGDVRTLSQAPVEVTIRDVPAFFGRILADALVKAGVAVAGSNVASGIGDGAVRAAQPHDDLSGGTPFAVVTTPMTDVLQRCNSDSENLYAECLLKRMGNAVTREPGSWTNGPTVMRMIMTDKLGPAATASTTIKDGSGMCRENTVAPETLTAWLRVMAADQKAGGAFVASLATPGAGTLQHRFRGAQLANSLSAKSGRINFVRTLSGYVTHEPSGRRVAFSVLCNDVRNDPAALQLHEDVVRLIDDWLSKRPPAQPRSGG